jgi:hypothetical protein
MFPDDCVQSIVGAGKWWVKNETQRICKGALVFAFAPHVDQVPYGFEPTGRTDPARHDSAVVRVAPLKVDQPLKQTALPVAAMPLHGGEVWAAYRAKRRPCLVICSDRPVVDPSLTRGMPNNSTAPTRLVAPYYGVTKTNQRAGYRAEFVERVRHCEYRQFLWDVLPFAGGEESILRLDHIQPIGAHHNAYKLTDFRLSDVAIEVLDELVGWLLEGGVKQDSLVAMYRLEIEQLFG